MPNLSKNSHGGKRPNAGRKPTGKETVVIRVDKALLPEIERLKHGESIIMSVAYRKLSQDVKQLREENEALKNQLKDYRSDLTQELERLKQHLN